MRMVAEPPGRRLAELGEQCAWIARSARWAHVDEREINRYAASLPIGRRRPPPVWISRGERAEQAALSLTTGAISFGSGWADSIPSFAMALSVEAVREAVRDRIERHGPWTATELAEIEPARVAFVLHFDPRSELVALYTDALRDLGMHVQPEHRGSFLAAVDGAGRYGAALVEELGGWDCFADSPRYDGSAVPFMGRARLVARELHEAGAADFTDLECLTPVAGAAVAHVLRLDGILGLDPHLLALIDRGEPLEAGSPEEVELRACATHAVQLIAGTSRRAAALRGRPGTGLSEAQVDEVLCDRARLPRYRYAPTHWCPCTAY